MDLKKIVDSFDEKKMQQLTDAAIGFFITTIPKAIGKGVSETYSLMRDGIVLIKENYKQRHDEKTFVKLFREREENKTNFCETDYRSGSMVCITSKKFYDKDFVKFFCNSPGYGPDLSVKIKKNGSHFHKSYCGCSKIQRKITERKETLINPN